MKNIPFYKVRHDKLYPAEVMIEIAKAHRRAIMLGYAKDFGMIVLGAALFFTSFHIGESTWIGGIMHLTGCSFVCLGVHKRFHLH